MRQVLHGTVALRLHPVACRCLRGFSRDSENCFGPTSGWCGTGQGLLRLDLSNCSPFEGSKVRRMQEFQAYMIVRDILTQSDNSA